MRTLKSANPTICFCHAVKRSELVEAIQRGMITLYEIQAETLACTGCGGCEMDILELIGEVTGKPEDEPSGK